MRTLLFAVFVVAACGARSGTPITPQPNSGSGSSATVAPKPNVNGPSEPECDQLYAHAFAIVLYEQAPAEGDAVPLRTEMRPAFIADCRAGTREYHQCGLAAKTQADLVACKR